MEAVALDLKEEDFELELVAGHVGVTVTVFAGLPPV